MSEPSRAPSLSLLRSRTSLRLTLLVLGISTGCHERGDASLKPAEMRECLAASVSYLYGADAGWLPPFLVQDSSFAVGVLENSGEEALCTGVLIDERIVLTAKHCDREESIWFRTGNAEERARALALERFVHPELDVMLLRLDAAQSRGVAKIAAPIALFAGGLGNTWIGRDVVLAGLGEIPSGERGQRLFVTESIFAVQEEFIVVDGKGKSGACAGDSGGPLLYSLDGSSVVLGILSKGSTSCVGKDLYTRADRFLPWVLEVTALTDDDTCESLGIRGTCDWDGARWCENGKLTGTACTGKMLCGLDEQQRSRCVDSEVDPCRGVGPDWVCFGSVLSRCHEGSLQTVDCSACEMRCASGGESTAHCVGPQAKP